MCVPIHGRDRVTAVIMVARRYEHGAFSPTEVQMVEEMAAQASMSVEQAMLFMKLHQYAKEIEVGYDSTLKVLSAALDTKDQTTHGHSERVARLTLALAREMGVPNERLVDIERGALLHDVGKIGVPDEVLRKKAALDDREWEAMQKHPLLAGLMVSKVGFLEGALPILLYHHERYDGSGYPFGLQGSAIPLEARIFTVVDAFDAMISDRPYRDALTPEAAMEEVRSNAGIQFDPDAVDAFERVIARQPPHIFQEDHAKEDDDQAAA
jgi:putative nucleotidyltransferase with HDIG domain